MTVDVVRRIVYLGPAGAGKTANLRHLSACVDPARRGSLKVLDPGDDPGLRMEFLPLDLEPACGLRLRLQVYGAPGAPRAAGVREALLRAADGVVFVADSAGDRTAAAADAWLELRDGLAALDREPGPFPTVLQYNKRDLPGAAALESLEEELNSPGLESYPAAALTGVGVVEAFRAVARQIAHRLAADPPAGTRPPLR